MILKILALYSWLLWTISSTRLWSTSAQQLGNISCADSGLNWYTDIVGETPCKTYARLRRLCNGDYKVGQMNPNTPPDVCDDPVGTCCCNSISFSLSMLCLNCQHGVGNGNGIDAGAGAYQDYLGRCSPRNNLTIPDSLQTTVCQRGIRIFDDLYKGFGGFQWSDGSWFYNFMKNTINDDNQKNNNNSFTRCDSALFGGGPPSPRPGNKSGGISGGAIAGIVIGVVVFVGLIIGMGIWLWKRHRQHQKNLAQMVYARADPLILVGSASCLVLFHLQQIYCVFRSFTTSTGHTSDHESSHPATKYHHSGLHATQDPPTSDSEPEQAMYNRPPPAYDEETESQAGTGDGPSHLAPSSGGMTSLATDSTSSQMNSSARKHRKEKA
ncbi:hypothetical protein D9758_016838 [Tetrapyrgos nigripes]|uniref:Uncharacterized protein n=1 Tax=Tetrapyrgos nigripes TaxID=182062 RepID=A0A8H5C966_9AGAR|nr:hypothetical protein D9758_016838 [Tetrapyrgos nigripes]